MKTLHILLKSKSWVLLVMMIPILLLGMSFMACQNQEEAELKSIYQMVYATSGDEQKKSALDFLDKTVIYQQAKQDIATKKMNIDLLNQGVALADDMLTKFPELESNIDFRVNQATILNLTSSYAYDVLGDIELALQNVARGIDILDELVDQYPDNILVYAYRGINASYFPDILEKKAIVTMDFERVIDYVLETETFSERDKELFGIVVKRAKFFFEQKNIDTEYQGLADIAIKKLEE